MLDVAEYCRQLETYLCQKNEGHLIRIVGPVFEQVCGWADQGVPLKIALRGIDRYCERYYAKGPKRRPVRIEFCEADILELFDDWRRAVGVSAGSGAAAEPVRKWGLASHLERVVARLKELGSSGRAPGRRSAPFLEAAEAAALELERMVADARRARGQARAAILRRLADLDQELMSAAMREVDDAQAASLRQEAEAELAPFGSRLAPEARASAASAAFHRLLRESVGLPVMTYE
jgi:hypothetical protein